MLKRIAQKLRPNNNPVHLDRVRIEYGEILSQGDCDSILFFMHPSLKWGGGLNSAVLALAGAELDHHICEHVITPKNGEVFTLPAFNAPYKALFLAVLADWDGGNGFEERDLMNCYRDAIVQAEKVGIRSIAIPALGRDKRDFPHIRFARLALKGISERLDERLDYVKIMCIDHTMMRTYQEQMEKMKRRAA
jgi:O-acetyl-ADP-ribose deacetylase (regulator of RNase III)